MHISPDAAVRQWFARVWNEGDESTIDTLMATDAVVHGLPSPDGQPLRGPAAFKPFFHTIRGALGDIRIDVLQTMTDGDLTMAYCHVTARHTGDGLGFAATQKPVDFYGFTMLRVADGQIVEGWNSFDFLKMYEQLGVPLKTPE